MKEGRKGKWKGLRERGRNGGKVASGKLLVWITNLGLCVSLLNTSSDKSVTKTFKYVSSPEVLCGHQ